MIYLYESHLGGLYIEDRALNFDELYCKTCGDSDQLAVSTDDIDDVEAYLRERVALFGSGGLDQAYCEQILDECRAALGEEPSAIIPDEKDDEPVCQYAVIVSCKPGNQVSVYVRDGLQQAKAFLCIKLREMTDEVISIDEMSGKLVRSGHGNEEFIEYSIVEVSP